jgi:UDP-N-acetylglucosamine--N-acetylmuramyl-(pentapeptide) pyrophosphoryl-undecaprenol N-acetylglucosamine transferase
VHEANPRPGLANRLGARLTDHVFTGHPDTPLARAKYVGIPLRREIVTLDRLSMGDKARSWFGLEADLPTLLVTGGSQGARSLNQAALAAAPALRKAGVQVLHVIGPKNTLEVEPPPGDPQYVVLQYVDRMDLAYAAADFALCRSGAMTCAELTAVGLPAAYIPLPHGNGEQRLNAMPIVQGGGGIMIDDADLTSEWIIQNLLPILSDPERVVIMSEAASRMGRKDADVTLARQVMQIAQQGRSK